MKGRKRMKKRYKILIAIVIIVLLIPPFNYFVLRDSVMEEIYRAVYWGNYTGINKMEGLNKLIYESIDGMLFMGDSVWITFDEEYIDENFNIDIGLYPEERREETGIDIQIYASYRMSDTLRLCFTMLYNHDTRTMIYDKIYISERTNNLHYYDEETIKEYLSEYDLTVENITEFQEYILYDVVYQSWVSGTDNGRKLNKWDYRNIKVVDNTFAEWE